MADQYYIEEGYIEQAYFERIVESDAISLSGAFTPTMIVEIADDTGYFIPDYIEEGYFALPVQEASASLSSSVSLNADVGLIKVSEVQMGVQLNVETVIPTRIRETLVDISGAMTANIVAVASKNGEIILTSSISMSTDADVTRDADITLANIVNLSLQNDRIRASSSVLSASFTQSVNAIVTYVTDSNLDTSFTASATTSNIIDFTSSQNSEFALEASALNVQQADSAVNAAFTLTANAIEYQRKTLPFGRPNNFVPYFFSDSANQWYPEGDPNFNSDVEVDYISSGTTLPPFLEYRVSFVDQNPGFAGDMQALVCPLDNISIGSNEDFTINLNIAAQSSTDWYNNEVIYCSLGNGITKPVGTAPNDKIPEDTSKINIGFYRIANDNIVPYARVGNNNLFGSNTSILNAGWLTLTRNNGTIKLFYAGNLLDSLSNNTSSFSNVNSLVLYDPEGRAGPAVFDRVTFYKGKSIDGASFSQINNTFTNDIDTTVVFANFEQTLDDNLIGFVLDASANLETAATLTASGGKVSDITTLNAGTFALTADVGVTRPADAALDSEFTQTALTGFLKDAVPDLDVIASQIAVVAKVGDFLVDISMNTTLAADVNEIVQLASDLASNFAQNVAANITADALSNLSLETQISADNDRFRNTASNQSSQFTQETTGVVTRDATVNLSANFVQNADAIKAVEAQADVDAAATLTADNVRVRFASADFEAFAATLTAGSKIGDYLIDVSMNTTLSVDANVKTGSVIAFDSAFDTSAELDRYRFADSAQSVTFTQTSAGIINVEANSNIDSSFAINVDAVKTTDAQIDIDSALDFAAIVKANLAGEIDFETSATLSVTPEITRTTSVTLDSAFAQSGIISRGVDGAASISAQFTQTVDGRLIVFPEELEYQIPRETREFALLSENRSYSIKEENREFVVEL